MRHHASSSPLTWILSAGLALLGTAAPLASAQAQDSGQSKGEKAKKYYKKGMQHFYEEDYPMAITNFKRANSISPNATLSYNISIAYSRMGKPDEALTASLEAKERGGLPKDTLAKNDGRIAAYRRAIKAERLAGGGEESGGATSGGQASNQTNASQGGSQNAGGGQSAPPPRTDSGGGALQIVGISVGVGGLAMLGSAIGIGANVSSKIDEKRTAENNGRFERAKQLRSEIGSQQTLGQVLLYSGIGATAVGTTLFILDATSSSSSGQAVNVTGGPTRGGLQVGVDVSF
jgi:tetratricopeptide (TPR) repeat protein